MYRRAKHHQFRFLIPVSCLIAGLLLLSACAKQEVPLIPIDVLLGNPHKTMPRLSPDGTQLAYLSPVKNVLNIWVGKADGSGAKPVTKAAADAVKGYFWTADSKRIVYFQDQGGDENWRLNAVEVTTGEVREFARSAGTRVGAVAALQTDPDWIVITVNKDDPSVQDAYRLNLTTGELVVAARGKPDVFSYAADADLQVRAMVVGNELAGADVFVRASERDEWRKLLTWTSEDVISSDIIQFTADGNSLLLMDASGANAARLVEVDINSGLRRVLAEDSVSDIGAVTLHPTTQKVQAAWVFRERREAVILDEAIRPDLEALARVHRGELNILSRDNADSLWVVAFSADDGPVAYYLWRRNAQMPQFLFYHRPELNDYTLARMEPIQFEARDGLVIHGYLTFPPDQGRANLPLVVLPHGGPWYRDYWEFNTRVQWLANRGYLVLQVNYRGSSGYGKAFLNAGNREWGRKMLYDVVDGVQWCVNRGFADKRKVGIFGWSYGGYIALAGAAFTPDVFCCAVDAMGVSNLVTWVQSYPPYWEAFRRLIYERVGNPATDAELLRERSPLFSADKIRIPMMIVQGANDVRVTKAEAEQMVAALKENGVPHEYLLFENEGHQVYEQGNIIRLYSAAESFFAQHLGGRVQANAPGK